MLYRGWKTGATLVLAAGLTGASCGGSDGGGDGDAGDGDAGDGDAGDGDGNAGDGDGDALGGGAGAAGDGDGGTGGDNGGTGGGNVGTGGDGEPCAGVVCETPPDATCNSGTLTIYDPIGVCSSDACEYSSTEAACTEACDGAICSCSAVELPLVTSVFSSQSEMAIDSQGGIHVVYKPGLTALYAYKPAAGAWNHGISIPDNAAAGIALALDSDDGVHIALNRGGENGLGYTYRPAGGSFSTQTIAGTAGMGLNADIALDSSDNIYIVHTLDEVGTEDDRIQLTTKIGAAAFATTLLFATEDEVRSGGTIAIGPDDTIYFAYTDITTYNAEKLRLATRAPDASTFVSSDIDPTRYGSAGSLAVDQDGGLHISYYDNSDYAGYLRYGYRAAGSSTWQTVQADSEVRAGFDSSLGVERDGTVHIVHHLVGNQLTPTNPANDLRYSRKEPGGSFSSVTVEDAGIVGEGPSMALEVGGIVHVAFGNRNESTDQDDWTLDYRRLCPD